MVLSSNLYKKDTISEFIDKDTSSLERLTIFQGNDPHVPSPQTKCFRTVGSQNTLINV